jgi:hypothetical protein
MCLHDLSVTYLLTHPFPFLFTLLSPTVRLIHYSPYRFIVTVVSQMAGWFIFSACLSAYNKVSKASIATHRNATHRILSFTL